MRVNDLRLERDCCIMDVGIAVDESMACRRGVGLEEYMDERVKAEKVELVCAVCGERFMGMPNKRQKVRYCSKRHKNTAKMRRARLKARHVHKAGLDALFVVGKRSGTQIGRSACGSEDRIVTGDMLLVTCERCRYLDSIGVKPGKTVMNGRIRVW